MKWTSGRLWLRIIVYSLTSLSGLFILTQALILWQFNETAVRNALTHALKNTGRTVQIQGAITPHALPFPGVDIDNLIITEPDGSTPFARIAHLKARLGWGPLLLGNREVRSISLTGFHLIILHTQEGTLSISDLFRPSPNHAFKLNLDSLSLRKGRIQYKNASRTVQGQLESVSLDAVGLLGDAQLRMSAVASHHDRPIPLTLATPLTIQHSQVTLKHLQSHAMLDLPAVGHTTLQAQGKLQLDLATLNTYGENLTLTFKPAQPGNSIRVFIPTINASSQSLFLPHGRIEANVSDGQDRYQLDVSLQQLTYQQNALTVAQLRADADWQRPDKQHINLTLSAPLSLSNKQQLRLDPLNLTAHADLPAFSPRQLIFTMAGAIDSSLNDSQVNLYANGQLDGSTITLAASQYGFTKPRYSATVSIGQLDLNRYLPESSAVPIAVFQQSRALSLDWLDFLDLSGKISVGQLSVGRFRVKDILANIRATPQALKISGMSANIYSGQLQGDMNLNRIGTPTLELTQTLKGMSIQPLLIDLFDFNRLDGNGNGYVNLKAHGRSFADLRNTLSGEANISLNHGALIGIDLVSALKNLPAELKKWNRPGQPNQKTTFSSLSAHLTFDKGVGRNQDLSLVSQLINIRGSGKIDLRQNIIDYALTVRANPAEFAQLKGINVPLKITGPLNTPVYALDFNALVKGKRTAPEKQQALKQELKKQIITILP